MEVRFEDEDLDRLEIDPTFTARLPTEVVRGYRKAMNWIRAASDERDFYAMKGLHFEKLEGREGEHSMRLNKQFRLILAFETGRPKNIVVILGIEDYH